MNNNISIEERVRYYTNNLKEKNIKFRKDAIIDNNKQGLHNKLQGFTLEKIKRMMSDKRYGIQGNKPYGNDLLHHLEKYNETHRLDNDKYFICKFGDNTDLHDECVFFVKSRKVTDKTSILLRLNRNRHWRPVNSVKSADMPFDKKVGKLVWRGVTTGTTIKENRLLFVEKNINNKNCNVGFNGICQGKKDMVDSKYVKNSLSLKEQLRYKYIMSLEGNDVASGLKWQLYSNSVVFMRKPRFVSWAMEDMLKPYVHYIPVNDDFNNISEQIHWAEQNQDKCKQIIKNANAFIEQFLNEKKEQRIHQLVIDKYFKNVKIELI